MKLIILLSSLFYILGLKIGNKIDLIKKSIPVEKIITHKIKTISPSKCVKYCEEATTNQEVDTTRVESIQSNKIIKNEEL